MNIKFNVSNMKLSVQQPSQIVANSKDYLVCEFYFKTDDWQGKEKRAYFSYGYPSDINKPIGVDIDVNGECKIPSEVLTDAGYVYIGVGGVEGSIVIPTNYVKFKLLKGVDFLSSNVPDNGEVDVSNIIVLINSSGELEITAPDEFVFSINNNELEVTTTENVIFTINSNNELVVTVNNVDITSISLTIDSTGNLIATNPEGVSFAINNNELEVNAPDNVSFSINNNNELEVAA